MPEVSSAYPQAAGRHFPPFSIEDLWAAPDGWPIRRITCPALHRDGSLLGEGAGRGRLLFMPGRGDIYEKYLESLDDWQRCGWHVTALDWRGQGGSGRLGLDDTTGHIGDFTQWVNDLSAFWREWVRPGGGPHVLVAHSMGGHLALRAVVERKLTPDALILSAPMLGFFAPGLPVWVQHLYARLMAGLGDSRRPAWKGGEKPGSSARLRMSLLTHDQQRSDNELWWREQRPWLNTGAASWRWMERAVASRKAIFAPGLLEAVQVPVLLMSTRMDRLVSHKAVVEAARRLPHAQLIELGREARHELLREEDGVRGPLMATIDAFLDAHAPVTP